VDAQVDVEDADDGGQRRRSGPDRDPARLGPEPGRAQAGQHTVQRVVERGKVITAAGVSAGIDMALTLLGDM
jgi:hypothetical protein